MCLAVAGVLKYLFEVTFKLNCDDFDAYGHRSLTFTAHDKFRTIDLSHDIAMFNLSNQFTHGVSPGGASGGILAVCEECASNTLIREVANPRFHGLAPASTRPKSKIAKRENGIWQRRTWEHAIRDDADFGRHVDFP